MADGITRIAVEGFKSIVNRQEIEIAPLTILAGANSSGKSSIMQPLLLLKQTLEATYDPGPLKIDGPNVYFTSVSQFLSKGQSELRIEIFAGEGEFDVIFSKELEIKEETRILRGGAITLLPQMSPASLQQIFGHLFAQPVNHMLSIVRDRCFLDIAVVGGPAFRIMSWIEPFIDQIIHVPALRGSPSRTYPRMPAERRFPGTFESYTASLIQSWAKEPGRKCEDLNQDLQLLGLAQEVFTRRLDDVSFELMVGLDPHAAEINIADVGFGVSQVVPVLVALRAADEGRLVYLEEPEIHLHPRAQTKLADVLAGAAKRGVRVVAETHSSLLLRAIQTLVAKGDLPRELVRLHWFSRDQDGITHVTTAKLDENGAFGDWPEDFGDVALESEKQYLDAVEDRLTH